MKLGAVDFLQKPFTPRELRDFVYNILKRESQTSQEQLDYQSTLRLAKNCARKRQFDSAIAHAKEAIGIDPSQPEAFTLLGELQEVLGDRTEALKNYRVAIDLDPTYKRAKDNLSRATRSPKIGMAPGVGKTYRMLKEAYELKAEEIDVVIGILETHGRKETAEAAQGLEIVPRQPINRNGVVLTEMDTEAILARQPQLVLIDELAHTNVPGSERDKRYQDVEVILEAGIDVFSTLNIQHLENLNDLVAKLTGVVVRERIPDRLLDEADEVVVVDVTPETLQERLIEGKIYAPEKIEQSLENFFVRRNLVALRELALREVADNLEEILSGVIA